jgi:predicted amidohydrolase YtcJ
VLIDGLDTADMEPFSKTIQTPLGERRFEIFHWKRYLDGSFGAQSAHLLEPYMGSESVGQQLHEDEELFDAAKNALAKGFALSFHAIGDAAIEQVLRLSAVLKDELQEANRRFGYRAHRIEHAQLVNAEQIKRFKEEYPFWSIPLQPLHEREDLRFVKRFIGAERFEKNAYRLQSLEDAGFPISIGTDAPVVSSDPVETIRACQELKTLSERWPIDKVISYYIWKGRRNHALPDREIHEGSLVYLKEL